MFISKPLLLPNFLVKHEFKIYLLSLILSRFLLFFFIVFHNLYFVFISPFIIWLSKIYELQIQNGITNTATPYPSLTNYLINILFSLTNKDLFLSAFLFLIINGTADVINGILIWKIFENSNKKYLPIIRWIYVYSLPPIMWVYSQMVFEPLIGMTLILSIYLINKDRKKFASFILSMGTSLKLFPILLLLSILIKNNFKQIRGLFLSFLIIIIFLNFEFFYNFKYFIFPYIWQLGRPSWGSIFTVIENIIGNNIGLPIYQEWYKVNESTDILLKLGIIGITPEPFILSPLLTSINISFTKLLSFVLIILSISIFLYFAKKLYLDYLKIALGIFSLFFAFSYGFSPQYSYYVFLLLLLTFNPENFKSFYFIIFFQILMFIEYPIILSLMVVFLNLDLLISLAYLIFIMRFIIFLSIPYLILSKKL